MDILKIFQEFTTQEQAIDYLERVRWRGRPVCPYCESVAVGRHASKDRQSQRWQCRACHRAFAVTVGTLFHRTHIPLRTWFLVLGLMLNAKKSASACQIARDVGVRRATVWSMMHRIRAVMANDPMQAELLHGIVEADETYIGGKPRKPNDRSALRVSPGKAGRGTAKTPVIGVVERGGRVVAKVAERLDMTRLGAESFIRRHVDTVGSLLMTDEYGAYNSMSTFIRHATVNHQQRYADGLTHTNTIESVWALVKRAWYGQHHHYSRKYLPLYIAEACFKYNRRKMGSMFADTVAISVSA